MSVHVFVDENKRGGHVLAAAVLAPHQLAEARREMRTLCLPGQQRVHVSKERAARRVASSVYYCGWDVGLRLYDAGAYRDSRAARTACLRRLVADLAEQQAQRLVIEQDDSLVEADRADLWPAVRACRSTLDLDL